MPKKKKTVDTFISNTTKALENKRTRSFILLLVSFIIILAVNSLLPVIEGEAHFTAEAVTVTYSEYVALEDSNDNYRLTWLSEQNILIYRAKYVLSHPEINPEDAYRIEVPADFTVRVYTKFFYQSIFWYISTVTSLASSVILFYSLFNYLITTAKEKYKKYVDLEAEVDRMTDENLDPVTFEPWVDEVFNAVRKINQHKANVRYKLDKLERLTPYRIRRIFRDYFSPKKSEEEKKPLPTMRWYHFGRKHYIRRKEKLTWLLDPAYISESVPNGHVKYFKHIYPMFVYSGSNSIGKTVDSYSLIKSDSERIASDASNKVLFSIICVFLFAVLFTVTAVSSSESSALWIVINIVSKLAPLLIQIPFAIDYSNSFMNEQLMSNLLARRSIGLLYLAFMKNRTIASADMGYSKFSGGEPDAKKS